MKWHLNHAKYGNKPWAVQQAYIDAAEGHDRFGSFLEQGLGKSASNLNEYINSESVDLNIVLAPSSFVGDWPLAPEEWGLGFLQTGMYPRDPLPLSWESGLYTFSHETLRGSLNARNALLRVLKERRCLLTFDEATGIKNPTSLLAKYMVSEAVKHAKMVRLLDGTPIVQNVMDYYAKLRCLGEVNGMNPYVFRNRFARMGGFMGKQITGMANEEELARILNRCSFRALKKDWRKDMPDQIERPIRIEMTDNQRKHYRTMLEEFYATVGDVDPEEINADLVLTQRMKLQQISSCMLMKDGKAHWIEEPKNNPKLRAIKDTLEIGQGKAIIVYYFDPSGRMLIDEMTKEGLNPAWIVGKMKPDEIIEQKRRFNRDPTCRVIVAQQDQGSRGHTLIGEPGDDRCNMTFYYENSLSLMHRLQMNDRNHRGEQDQVCYLIDLICGPIDQINVDILTGKRTMAQGMDALIKLVRSRGKLDN